MKSLAGVSTVLMRVMNAVKETIADVSSVSPPATPTQSTYNPS